jgi:hypothetical protein
MQHKNFNISLPTDVADVEAWEASGGGVRLPEGEWDVEIVNLRLREATERNSLKADVVVFNYKCITEGEFFGELLVGDQLSTSEGALGKFKQHLLAVSKGKQTKGDTFKSKSYLGKQLRLRTYIEADDDGTERVRYTDYAAFNADEPAPGATKGGANGGGKPAKPAPEKAAKGGDDDEVDDF